MMMGIGRTTTGTTMTHCDWCGKWYNLQDLTIREIKVRESAGEIRIERMWFCVDCDTNYYREGRGLTRAND